MKHTKQSFSELESTLKSSTRAKFSVDGFPEGIQGHDNYDVKVEKLQEWINNNPGCLI